MLEHLVFLDLNGVLFLFYSCWKFLLFLFYSCCKFPAGCFQLRACHYTLWHCPISVYSVRLSRDSPFEKTEWQHPAVNLFIGFPAGITEEQHNAELRVLQTMENASIYQNRHVRRADRSSLRVPLIQSRIKGGAKGAVTPGPPHIWCHPEPRHRLQQWGSLYS